MQEHHSLMGRFLARVDEHGPLWKQSPCWLWTGALQRNGYGSFPLRSGENGSRIAHRASWLLHKGQIPRNLVVRHLCARRDCVNPAHLRLGTQSENMRDFRELGHASLRPTPRAVPRPRPVWRLCRHCGRLNLSSPSRNRTYCSLRCREDADAVRLASENRERARPAVDRFWQKVDKTATCWVWMGPRTLNGYGTFKGDAPQMGAHRYSWILHYGSIPPAMSVLHNCPGGDNRACVNPDHLWLGRASDNMRDAVAKGRMAMGDAHHARRFPDRLQRGDAHWRRRRPDLVARGIDSPLYGRPRPDTRGEANGNSRWTADQIREIRRRVGAGELQAAVARSFGMAASTMSAIVGRKIWPELE